MAKRQEEVVLDLSIESKDSFSELERLKKGIIGLKEEQQQLTKAYKAGTITQQEYAKEVVRVEALLKKQTATYSNVQKSVTGVKSSMDKWTDSLKQNVSQMNVAGVNMGALGTKLTSLLNPTTALITAGGLLFTAYSKSTIGAKDLDFAQNQLAASTSLLTNRFAALISSGKDGEGFFSRLADAALQFISPSLAAESKFLAQLSEKLEDLGRDEIQIRSTISDRLADNQDKLTEIADAQTSYNKKVKLGQEIVENLRKNQDELTKNLKDQLYTITAQLAMDAENEGLLTKKLEKEREINKLTADTEKKIQGQLRANENIVSLEEKRQQQLKEKEEDVTGGRKMTLVLPKEEEADALEQAQEFADMLIEVTKNMGGQEVEIYNQTADGKIEADKRVAENRKKTSQEDLQRERAVAATKLQLAAAVSDGIAGIFRQGSDAQRIFALTAIALDTAVAISSLTRASEANPANSVTFGGAGAAQFIAGLARILANIAQARKYLGGKAAGGGDFVTSGPSLLLVGDNPGGRERVTVEPLSGKGKTQIYPHSGITAMAGGGTMTTNPMGASIARSITNPINMSFEGNQVPSQVWVSWTEGQRMSKMVEFKEKLTTA